MITYTVSLLLVNLYIYIYILYKLYQLVMSRFSQCWTVKPEIFYIVGIKCLSPCAKRFLNHVLFCFLNKKRRMFSSFYSIKIIMSMECPHKTQKPQHLCVCVSFYIAIYFNLIPI